MRSLAVIVAVCATALSACGGSNSSDSSSGDRLAEPCHGMPCIRLQVNGTTNADFSAAISCYQPTSPPAPASTRFEVDFERGTADFECDNEAGNLHLRGRLTGFGGPEDASGPFGPETRIVLSATGKPLEELGPDFAAPGSDLMPTLESPPLHWTVSRLRLSGNDDGTFLLPLGSNLGNYTMAAEAMIRIPFPGFDDGVEPASGAEAQVDGP